MNDIKVPEVQRINTSVVSKKSNKFVISSTSIIATIILLVVLFIIIYNCYIYPLLHQNKLQLTQELYNSYITNIKSNDAEFLIDLNNIIITLKEH